MKPSVFEKITVLILLMTILSVFSFASVFAADRTGFIDFPIGWSAEAVGAAVDNGLLTGKTSNTLDPEGLLTRAEMAAIINRAFGSAIEADISRFTDVSKDAWYYHDIAKAVYMGTFRGDGGNAMRPDDNIIREEAFAVVARAYNLINHAYTFLDRFKDASLISDWAKPYVSALAAESYVNGDDFSNINPGANITREEMAQLIYNMPMKNIQPEDKKPDAADEIKSSKYTVKFETNGGTDVPSVSYGRGALIDLSTYVSTKPGYVFDGWYKDIGMTESVGQLEIQSDMIVYAAWMPEELYYEQYAPKPSVNVDEYIAQMYELEAEFTSRLGALYSEAMGYYDSAPPEEKENAKSVILSDFYSRATALEAECDGRVNMILSELDMRLSESGEDKSIINEIRDTYFEEKNLEKDNYLNMIK